MRGLRHCRSLLNDNIKHRNETMARETEMSQSLMSGALLHFQSGVPIKDLDMRREHKDRLARVAHVYWVWIKDPMLDAYQMLRQLVKQTGSYSDAAAVTVAAQKDKMLFDFVIDHIQSGSRRQDELKVRHAAEKMIRIGLETDNVMALDKGSKRLYEVAGLDKPEQEQADMNKVAFLPSVVVTNIEQIDPDKTYTVASSSYILLDAGDGNTAFLGATLLQSSLSLDYQALIDYIQVELSGVIGEQYANPYGQGRIRIVE